MPTAAGFVKATSGTKAIASFSIDDLQYTFSCNIEPNVQPFQSHSAMLTYSDMGDLTAARDWNGQVGSSKVKMNISNGPSIEGSLDMPVSPASVVVGTGVWIQN
jgi:hypothetical protein